MCVRVEPDGAGRQAFDHLQPAPNHEAFLLLEDMELLLRAISKGHSRCCCSASYLLRQHVCRHRHAGPGITHREEGEMERWMEECVHM